jgi:transposase
MSETDTGAPLEAGPPRLSDDDWSRIEHLFLPSEVGPGRPRRNARQMIDAVLWVCFDGHKWHRLPASYPPQQTCYTHFLKWRRDGVLKRIAEQLDIPYDRLCAIEAPPK